MSTVESKRTGTCRGDTKGAQTSSNDRHGSASLNGFRKDVRRYTTDSGEHNFGVSDDWAFIGRRDADREGSIHLKPGIYTARGRAKVQA